MATPFGTKINHHRRFGRYQFFKFSSLTFLLTSFFGLRFNHCLQSDRTRQPVENGCKQESKSLIGTDVNPALIDFSNTSEAVCVETVEAGQMTKDLAVCIHGNKVNHGEHYLYTEEFLDVIDQNLKAKLVK